MRFPDSERPLRKSWAYAATASLGVPGATCHVMSRGDQRDDIFLSDVDRHDFIKTLAEAKVLHVPIPIE